MNASCAEPIVHAPCVIQNRKQCAQYLESACGDDAALPHTFERGLEADSFAGSQVGAPRGRGGGHP